LYAWISLLTTKDKAILATRQFLAFMGDQYHISVQMWMSDGGGEYKLAAFDELLRNKGIKILQSILYTPQQNGRAECLICTLSDKAESMCFGMCLPESWWSFAFHYACYIYNYTPQIQLDWHTHYELLKGEKPKVSYL